jgi:hypothetical protein
MRFDYAMQVEANQKKGGGRNGGTCHYKTQMAGR